MITVGDEFPASGAHKRHIARIVSIDWHGLPQWETVVVAPTVTVDCECGCEWTVELDELVGRAAA